MIPSSVWTMSVTSPQPATSFMAAANALAGAKRRIAAGRASTTSRAVTSCSLAIVSMTAPGSAARMPARSGFAAATCMLRRRVFALQRLLDLEALELRVSEIERSRAAGIAGARVRLAELLGRGPGFERRLALPDGVG